MISSLTHRGPDDEGTFESEGPEGTVWLGHRRLAILDLTSAAHQPMMDATSRFVLVFNGELYNYIELRAELIRFGHRFKGTGDTEVLLAAWAQWGVEALQRFRGMFAFALWDVVDRTLWLTRDRLGEKPLYFTAQKGRFLFASELRSLLASDVVDRRLDGAGLDAFLLFGCVSQPYTLLRGVQAVAAGEVVRVRNGSIEHHTYWRLADIPEAGPGLYSEAVNRLRPILDEAISLCTRSDVPLALLLSGGVDSTGILARLKGLGHSEVDTFSVVFEGADEVFSEQPWSDAAAQRFGSRHQRVFIRGDDVRTLFPRAMAAVDQPSHNGFNHFLVLQAIAAAGYKVALTGQGADELFLGYGRHKAFRLTRHIARARVRPRLIGSVSRAHRRMQPGRTSLRKRLTLLLPADPEILAYAVRHLIFSPFDIAELTGRVPLPVDHFIESAGGESEFGRLYRLETTHFMRNQLLRDGDQMSMACSLELRAPFVDYRLVEEVSSLHHSIRMRRGRQKPLLVDLLADELVALIGARPKVGFSFPLRRWLSEELAVFPVEPERLGLRPAAVREVEREVRAGGDPRREWMLILLSDWARRYGIEMAT